MFQCFSDLVLLGFFCINKIDIMRFFMNIYNMRLLLFTSGKNSYSILWPSDIHSSVLIFIDKFKPNFFFVQVKSNHLAFGTLVHTTNMTYYFLKTFLSFIAYTWTVFFLSFWLSSFTWHCPLANSKHEAKTDHFALRYVNKLNIKNNTNQDDEAC